MDTGPEATVTPFDPNSYSSEEITQNSRGSRTEQQPLISTEDPEGEMVALHHLSSGSSPPAAVLRSRPAEPVPASLSGKELARLRAEALASGSQQQFRNLPIPIVSQQSTSSPASAVTESGEAGSSFDPQRLQSEVESLRREMERLRGEGVIMEAPPSYTDGDR